jgi:diguanylate cyclase (GGDEF)-like protein
VRWLTFDRRARRVAPFAAAALLPYALLMLPATGWSIGPLLASLGLALAIGASAVLVPWARLPSWTHVLAPLGYVVSLALLRDAGEGANAGVGVLVLLPVFWLALYGTRAQLAIITGAVLAFFVLPALLVGAPAYPPAGIRAGILFTAVAGIVGVTVQGLVGRIRLQGREREELLAHLDELASTDPLTGLLNRRGWTAALQEALAQAERSAASLTVAMLDLDDFKAANDRHGHEHGDALLAQSAASWRASLRDVDVMARVGGDEFAVLLPGCNAAQAVLILNRMIAGTAGRTDCSAGVAEWERGDGASALMRAADRALYDAKRSGRVAVACSA